MTESEVFFIRVIDSDGPAVIKDKFGRLLKESKVLDVVSPKDRTVIKLHFGEEGNTGFVRPEYVSLVSREIFDKKASCVLSDTNTLYRGRRTNSADHTKIALEHGFTKDKSGAEVAIPDDTLKENVRDINIGGKFIKIAKVARIFADAEAFVDIAHFKGHIMTGFGGVLKNAGMGCASRQGKLAQHSEVSPFIRAESCVACGECVSNCPTNAISIKNKVAAIKNDLCIGCATCIAVCPRSAIDVQWESGGHNIQEKMIEYAFAVLKNKLKKSVFINFAVKITKECDCLAKDDPKISPDVGIFASTDPVAVDKAAFDMVNNICGRDIFKEVHPERNGTKQLDYAEKLGLGTQRYKLIEVSL